MPRGFDFSDEGYYAFLASPHQNHQDSPIQLNLFFKLLYKSTGVTLDLLELRVLRLVLYFIAVRYLLKTIYNLIDKPLTTEYYFLSWLFICVGYSFLPHSLSYNHLNTVIACILVYACLQRYYKHHNSNAGNWLIGFLLVFQLYVKPSSALIFILLIIFIEGVVKTNQLPSFLLKLLFIFITFEVLLFLFLGQNFFLQIVFHNTSLSSRPSYSTYMLFKTVFVGMFWCLLFLFSGYLMQASFKHTNIYRFFIRIVAVGLFVSVLRFIMITDESVYLVPAILLFWIGFLLTQKCKHTSTKKWALYILLFIIPFVLHLGSNVYFLRQVNHYAWSWGLIVISLLTAEKIRKFVWICTLIFTFVILDGLIYRPFGQVALWLQKEKWFYNQGKKSIMLESSTVEQLHQLQLLVEKYKVGAQEGLAFYRIPGYLYLIDLQMNSIPNLWEESQMDMVDWSSVQFVIMANAPVLPEPMKTAFCPIFIPNSQDIPFTIYVRKKHEGAC